MLRDKKVLLIIVAVLLLLGAGVYVMSSKKSASPNNLTVDVNQNSNTSAGSESPSSLKDLLGKGVSQTCTYSTDAGSGKVYVSAKMMRGDFESQAAGTTMKSHMIVKDNTSYIWTDDQKSGFKMTFDASTMATPTGNKDLSATTTSGFDPSTNYNYKCGNWSVDQSVFELPKGVSFTEFKIPGQASPGAQGGSGTGSSQCSYCNALQGDDKAQCLKALNCN